MVKKVGVIFAVLLVVLLLSNPNFNTHNQVFAQNTSGLIDPNTTQTPTPTQSPSTTITKLTGGVKINSPGKGDMVPLNLNKSLEIYGISKDNATSNCDVTIIVNNVKPYQNVQPTGIQGNNDYSTWKYTLASNYTSINEGNNKITSKIFCPAGSDSGSLGGGGGGVSQPASQAYYSVNVTGSNFTQAQLTNYELMLQSASNATNGGNTTLSSSNSTIQPVALIQQFNQDTGTGPVCCKTTSALTTQSNDGGSGSSSSSSYDDDDDDSSSSSSSSYDDDDDDSSSSSSSSYDDDDDDSSSSSSSSYDDDDDDSSSSSSSSSSYDDDDDDSSSSSSSSYDDDDDDSSSSSSSSYDDDDDDSSSSSSSSYDDGDDDSSSSSSSSYDDSFDFSNRMSDFDFGFDFDTENGDTDSSWSDDSGDYSGADSILDNVEDTMRSAGLDFSFN